MDDKTRLEQGIKVRREVLGDAWVDKSNKAQNDFNADWFDFIQRTAWGDIVARARSSSCRQQFRRAIGKSSNSMCAPASTMA